MELPATFGALLHEYRVRAGMTQHELAGRARVSVRALRDLEQGRVGQPRWRSVRQLAAALGLADADRGRLLAAAGHAATSMAEPRLDVGVLGPLVVRRGDGPVVVGQAKLRCLLGLLAVQAGQVVPRDELVDVLWGERPPDTCLALLHTYVARLRGLLEPGRRQRAAALVLVRASGGYLLDLDADQLDALRFQELAARARQGDVADDPARAAALLGRALAIWRGPALADLGPRMRQHPAAVALGHQRVGAALAFADHVIGHGRGEEAVAPLRALSHQEPLHEGVHARLMLALAGCGQQAAALQLFAELRGRLAEELGVEPGAELQQAHLRILRQQLPPTVAPQAAAPLATPAQLPADVAAFTGRGRDLEELDRLLEPGSETTAVVISAVTGTAGVGKTALAVRWAHRVRDWFPDGQLHVNLRGYAPAPPLRPLQALAGFLHALGVPAEQVPVDLDEAAGLYRTLLTSRRMLVLLDNARDAEQVRPLLPGGAGCLVIVTSRDGLGGLVAREGARHLLLDVLTPGEAVDLLARVLGTERVAGEPSATRELAEMCGLLPLALRIAAANLAGQPGQSVAGYVARLRQGDRLAELAVDGDPQAAVHSAFDCSYAALSPVAQRLFRLLGLVPGPEFTAPATAALAGVPLVQAARLLGRLAAAHLIEPHAPGRFGLHDLLRCYAARQARLQDTEPDRHAATARLYDWYLRSTDAAARLLYPEKLRLPLPQAETRPSAASFDEDRQALAWLDAERANLLAVIPHAAQHGPRPVAWLLADALRGYFFLRMHIVDWLAVAHAGLAAAEAGGDLAGQAAAQLSLADAHDRQGRYRQAVQHYRHAWTLSRRTGWLAGQSAALGNLGSLYLRSGQLREATDCLSRAQAIDRQLGWLAGEAVSLSNLGGVWHELGRLEEAADHHARALALVRQLESHSGEAIELSNLGDVYRDLGRLDEALDHLTRALDLHREIGNRGNEADTLRGLAEVHRDNGRTGTALELARAAVALARDTGERRFEADALNALASIQHCLARHTEAINHHQQALHLAREAGMRFPEAVALVGLAAAQQRLGDPEQARRSAEHALSLTRQAGFRVLQGRALTALAAVHLDQDRHDLAVSCARQALAAHRDTGDLLGQARTLVILGHALRDSGRADAARPCWQEALGLFGDIGTPDADQVRDLLVSS